MTPDFATLTVEQMGHVCRLTLNRPDRHNPLTPRASASFSGPSPPQRATTRPRRDHP